MDAPWINYTTLDTKSEDLTPDVKGLIWFALLLGALLLAGCFGPIVLTEADNGTIQAIDVGDVILVRLVGNPSTGYTWQRTDTLREGVLEPLGEGGSCGGGLVGSPSTFEFRFKAVSSGTTRLEFVYQRPWEEEPIDTFSVVIYVR
jgi:predicted secreted protein